MGRLAATVLRVVLTFGALLLLLVGVPLALGAAAGWPLPRSVPTFDELRTALGGSSIPDATILKTIAVIGWLAWVQVLTSTIVEVTAWLRGRAAFAVPLAGPVQPLVRYLVLSLLVSVGAGRSAATTLGIHPDAVLIAADHPGPEECVPVPSVKPVAVSAPGPPAPTHTVRPRDSLWKVAEEHLGDGLRWRELWELNRGVPQADGRSLLDADVIRPGWLLRLPSDAINVATGSGTPAPATTEESAEPPESPPAPPPTSVPVPETVDGAQAESAVADDAGGEDDRHRADEHQTESSVPAPVGIAAAALLAAGVVATINKLRRAQVRRRRPGHAIPTPQGETVAAENTLRTIAALDRAERVDLAMRSLAGCLATRHEPVLPPIEAVLVGADIEVLFADAVKADAGPFSVEAGGRAWTLASSADATKLDVLARGAVPPSPTLAAIGRVDDRDLLVDIEAAAVTCITGPKADAEAMAWSIAAALATSVWADDLRLVVVGEVIRGFEGLERVEVLDPADVAERLTLDIEATRSELRARGATSTLAARADGGSWTPTVVVVGPDVDDNDVERLTRLAEQGTGLSLVIAGDRLDADRRIAVSGGVVTVTPPGVVAATPELPERFRQAISEVVALAIPAEEPAGEPIIDLTAAETASGGPGPSFAVVENAASVDEGVLVARVLGPVELEGGRIIDRRKSEELVVYLALHPTGASEQMLKTALWPDSAPTSHTFNQVVSRARICLGTGPDGSHYLPRLDAGAYRLSEWVTTDVDRLEAAFRNARVHASADTVEQLASALRLVRGQPFQGVKTGYEWAHSEGFATRLEILTADAAHLVAEWHVERGEATAALWAAGQGLLAAPLDEALYRDRMRAYAMTGNHSAVESVMRELARAMDAVEPYDSLHPETVELFEELTRRRVG